MVRYIELDTLVAEIKRRIEMTKMLRTTEEIKNARKYAFTKILSFIDTLEVKDMSMPALDNGNMPIERWKAACKAASCQANYRKSKGLTETCDDYFVDGVQWADKHPIKSKEVNLDKEIDLVEDKYHGFESLSRADIIDIAKYFFELGLKVQ